MGLLTEAMDKLTAASAASSRPALQDEPATLEDLRRNSACRASASARSRCGPSRRCRRPSRTLRSESWRRRRSWAPFTHEQPAVAESDRHHMSAMTTFAWRAAFEALRFGTLSEVFRSMPHPILTREQRDLFWRNGYLVIEDVIDARLTAILRADLEAWSRGDSEKKPSGGLVNGGSRFDVMPGHSASEPPALRMVNSPVEVSEAYYHCMADSRMTDMVADLIGPDVKYYHSKIDLKLPGTATEVKWHQDFLLRPTPTMTS